MLHAERGCDDNTLKKCFHKAALVYHPDKGGSDAEFQLVNEAWQVLSDPVKRNQYDNDLKRYGWKDGLNVKPIPKTRAPSGDRRRETFEPQKTQQTSAPPLKPIDIPDNLKALSAKELMKILDSVGVKRDDCFEKTDLIKRVEEYQATKPGFKKQPTGASDTFQSSAKENAQPSQSTYKPSGKTWTYAPPPTHICFKITSVGNSEVGKSCLIKRYCEGRFVKRYISTIGVDYGVKKLTIKDNAISINFFDLSGNEEYKLIRTEFYEDTNGLVMVYDIDNRDSFSSLVHWEDEMKRNGVDMTRCKVIVCGNKCDTKGREVPLKDAQMWCKNRGYLHFETSASDAVNVTEAFETLFSQCLDQHLDDKRKFGIRS